MTKKQKQAAKARSKAWSPEARAKRAATMAAKRGRLEQHPDAPINANLRDVLIFLEHAEKAILKSGGKRITPAESYAMLALTTLRGG